MIDSDNSVGMKFDEDEYTECTEHQDTQGRRGKETKPSADWIKCQCWLHGTCNIYTKDNAWYKAAWI